MFKNKIEKNFNLGQKSIYIHIPFCRRKCTYCNFYFETIKPPTDFHFKIIEEWKNRKTTETINTLYFGGGTPSMLSPIAIKNIVANLGSNKMEITLECNPEDLNLNYLAKIKECGINRLSIGVQSFDNKILKFLGRKHTGEIAKKAILNAKLLNFKKISVDLIVGINKLAETELNWLRKQNIGHLSLYILTVEPKTFLAKNITKKRIQEPNESTQAKIYCNIQKQLKSLGYSQYEISNFALPNQESIHNQIYWNNNSYLGLGPGAYSLQINQDGSLLRRYNSALLLDWLKNPGEAQYQEEFLNPNKALIESLAFGIRNLQKGICLKKLEKKHLTKTPEHFRKIMQKFINWKWVTKNYKLTAFGCQFADYITSSILMMKSN